MKLFESQYDFTTTLRKALDDIDPHWETYPGLIVPGSHTPHMVEEKLEAIKQARENGIPFLGICFGHQLAAIEYARNVLKIKHATSEEFGGAFDQETRMFVNPVFVVKKRDQLKVGEKDGETYWSNYQVAIEWEKPKHFFTAQSHPEYQSNKSKPHPLLVAFLNYARSA